MNAPTRPPVPDSPLSRPYWEAAHQGRLVIQQCGQCGKRRHYPRLLCDACHTSDCTWVEASGRGLIHSWTVTHHAFHPAFKAELPYTLVTVDLQEGVRALGRWRAGTPAIGMPVRASFQTVDGVPELCFHPDSDEPRHPTGGAS